MRQLLLALAAGVVTNGVVVWVVQALRSLLFPLPAGMDARNLTQVQNFYASSAAPMGVNLLVVASFLLAAIAGGFVANRLAPKRGLMPALVVGQLALIIVVVNLIGAPHPTWVWLAALLVPVPFAWVGGRLGGGRPRRK